MERKNGRRRRRRIEVTRATQETLTPGVRPSVRVYDRTTSLPPVRNCIHSCTFTPLLRSTWGGGHGIELLPCACATGLSKAILIPESWMISGFRIVKLPQNIQGILKRAMLPANSSSSPFSNSFEKSCSADKCALFPA